MCNRLACAPCTSRSSRLLPGGHKERQCLSREGSGNTKQRQCRRQWNTQVKGGVSPSVARAAKGLVTSLQSCRHGRISKVTCGSTTSKGISLWCSGSGSARKGSASLTVTDKRVDEFEVRATSTTILDSSMPATLATSLTILSTNVAKDAEPAVPMMLLEISIESSPRAAVSVAGRAVRAAGLGICASRTAMKSGERKVKGSERQRNDTERRYLKRCRSPEVHFAFVPVCIVVASVRYPHAEARHPNLGTHRVGDGVKR